MSKVYLQVRAQHICRHSISWSRKAFFFNFTDVNFFWKMSNKNNQNCQMLRTICRFLSESAHHILFFCQKVRTICRFCRMMRTNRHFYLNLFRSLNCKRFLASTNHIGEQRGVFWRCNCTNPYITLFSVQNSQLLL